jgi:imidazolonepropionase-like amidohydrolase
MSYLPVGVLEMWQDQTPGRRTDRDRFDRREVAKYAFLKNLTLALRDGGVPLLLGTDASAPGVFPGRSAHLELSELVAAGLTPYEAIAAGTRAAGVFIGRHVPSVIPFGLVAPGYRADLILVRANPLDDVGNLAMIEGVMARGAWFSIDELRAKRDSIVASRLR